MFARWSRNERNGRRWAPSPPTEDDELSLVPIHSYQSVRWISCFIFRFRYLLRSAGRCNDHQKRPTAHYQTFEEMATAAAAATPSAVVSAGSCMGNGCRLKGATSSSSASRENIPSAEFMQSSAAGGNYRLANAATSSVSTIPMTLNTSAPPQSFRFRVAEYSEERKRSFVRLSRKYRQAQQSQGAQVRILCSLFFFKLILRCAPLSAFHLLCWTSLLRVNDLSAILVCDSLAL